MWIPHNSVEHILALYNIFKLEYSLIMRNQFVGEHIDQILRSRIKDQPTKTDSETVESVQLCSDDSSTLQFLKQSSYSLKIISPDVSDIFQI